MQKQATLLVWIFLVSLLVSLGISYATFTQRRGYQGTIGKLPPFSSPSGTMLTPANVFMSSTSKNIRTGVQTDGTVVDYFALLENTFIFFVPLAALGLLVKSKVVK